MKVLGDQLDSLVAIDFFCSAGGVSYGFKKSGIDILGGIDFNISCKQTYEYNIGAPFLNADIRKLSCDDLRKKFRIYRRQKNLIFIGCSPCQYYSNIKTSKGRSENGRNLLEDFQKFVDCFLPKFVVLENVPGFNKNKSSPINKFKDFLDKNEYIYADDVLNAKDYGVPQNRRRYILIAMRKGKSISLPPPTIKNGNYKTVYDAIGKNFPVLHAGSTDSTYKRHTTARLSQLNYSRILATPHNGGSRTSWPEELQLDCYKNHDGHTDVYGRMKWEAPSPTITTRFMSYSNGRYGHPNQNRAISLREGATLQSFPKSFKFFHHSLNEICKMIGNAVPPKMAQSIGKHIFKLK